MSFPRLTLIVLRSLQPQRTVSFYQTLGLHFQEERHGSGPVHWAANFQGVVLEVYPARNPEDIAPAVRLGFAVEDPAAILERLKAAGAEVASDLKDSPWGPRAVVRDPDGRPVEISGTNAG